MTDNLAPVQFDVTLSELQYNTGSGPVAIPTSSGSVVYDSVSSLRASASTTNIVFLDGYYSSGDTGKLVPYWWNSTDTRSDNGGTIIQVTGISTGRYNLAYIGSVPIDLFGAKSDGTDIQSSLQAAIDANLGRIKIPCGIFSNTSAPITITRSATIESQGSNPGSFPANSGTETKSVIRHDYNGNLFNITGLSGDVNASTGYGLENILIQQQAGSGTGSKGYAIYAAYTSLTYVPTWLRIRNVNIEVNIGKDDWTYGMYFDGGAVQNGGAPVLRDAWFENVRIQSGNNATGGVKLINVANYMFTNCFINGVKGDVYVTGSSGYPSMNVDFINCYINDLNLDYANGVSVIGGYYNHITYTSNTTNCDISGVHVQNMPATPPAGVRISGYCVSTGTFFSLPSSSSGSVTGSWTPACSAGTISVNNATYCKTGSLVYINFDITMPTSASSSQAIISGLVDNASVNYFNGSLGYTDSTSINIQGGVWAASANSFSFRTALNSGYATYANLSGKRLVGSFVYQI